MKLHSLKVVNFRGFAERELRLHPEFNVLIGDNATGKTSLLEAGAIALGSWLLGFRGTDARHIRPKDVRRIYEEVGERSRELPQYPVKVIAEGEVAFRIVGLGGEVGLPTIMSPIHWVRCLNGPGGKTTQVDASELKRIASSMYAATLSQRHVVLPVIRYFGAGRLWEAVRKTEGKTFAKSRKMPAESEGGERGDDQTSSPFWGYRLSVDKRCNPDDLIRWIAAERRFEIDDDRPSLALKAVYGAILSMMPELRTVRYNLRAATLIVEYRDGSQVRFSNLSDGYRNVLAIAADLAIRMVMLNPHLRDEALTETPGVVLIDELDLHLHPKWQRRIVEDLRRTFPLVQFICTTHSPFVVQSLRSGEELIALDAQPTAQVANLPIEEVAEGLMRVDEISELMGVDDAQVSRRYSAMKSTARNFLEDLEKADTAPNDKLLTFKRRLAEDVAPYADNPAYQAFLEMTLAAKSGKQR